MKHSEQLGDLATALAKAQGEMEHASKDKLNPHFKSKYADLGSVWDAVRVPLSKHGLSVLQLPTVDAGVVSICTILMHSSGQYIEATYALPAMKNDAQGFGSAITYMKRYALTGVGVAPEEDDGNAASAKPGNGHTESMPPQGPIGTDQDKKALANQWGAAAITQIEAHKSYDDLGVWHHKNADKIAAVRGHNEALHKRICAALDKKQNELRPIAAE